MNNIGFVLYTKGKEPGTLNADWAHSEDGSGKGFATGGPEEGFEGSYIISYFDQNVKPDVKRELEIMKKGETYKITWKKEGIITAVGLGKENEEGIFAGWKNI